jgi:DNA-binding NarL/FixJ family response regulator
MRVLLVDDHAIVRQGLMYLLSAEPDLQVIAEAADGKTAVELTKRLRPDVVLMDINMPIMNGVEATRAICTQCSGVRVIGLSMFTATEQAETLLSAGAVGYASKTDPPQHLLATIRACVPQVAVGQPDLFASTP